MNPARGIEKYPEEGRERFLSTDELTRLGDALREAETVGLPYAVDGAKPKAKHAPKEENRRTVIGRHAAAAMRLLTSLEPACVKSCTCGGSTSISSAECCSCPIARLAKRQSC